MAKAATPIGKRVIITAIALNRLHPSSIIFPHLFAMRGRRKHMSKGACVAVQRSPIVLTRVLQALRRFVSENRVMQRIWIETMTESRARRIAGSVSQVAPICG